MKRNNIPKFKGVYYRESESKRHMGKPDRCFDICFRDHQGKLIWEKVGWASEGYSAQMASNIRAERIRAIRHGEELPQKRTKAVTLAEVWQRYDEWLETGKRRPRDDRCRYHKHLEPRFGEKSLSEISPFDLERMKSELLKDGLSPATTKHCLVLVRQLFNKATSWKMWGGANPVREVKLPRLNNRRERFLTTEEVDRLLAELMEVSRQLYEISFLSLYTGTRAGEIFALKWGHVDTRNEIILVADPKGGASRNAFMSPEVKALLLEKENRKPDELVFLDRIGGQIKDVSDAFGRAVERLKFNEGISDRRQKVSFHTLRHTFASWLAIQGTPILTIKELLGHKTLAMTERYSHLIPDVKREAVAGIGRMMTKGSDADQGCCAQES
ncbi:MAG: tyrosine-type recombinase/integrase [Syntrophobacteraceae bacterium]